MARRRRREPGLLYVVKQLELASRARLDAILRPSGITTLQYTALTVLERRPAMTSSDLARASFVRPQSAADLVAALERAGLIERAPDPEHGRRRLIGLTPAGHDLLAEYAPRVDALERRMLAPLDREARERFRDYLVSTRHALTDDGPPSSADDA